MKQCPMLFLFNHYNACHKFEPDKYQRFLGHKNIEHDFLPNCDPRDSIKWLFRIFVTHFEPNLE